MTIENFEKYVTPIIRTRGEEYYADQRVTLVDQDGCTYYFEVAGTFLYDVTIELESDGKIGFHSCDCPYEGQLCKHEVACLFYLRDMLVPEAAKTISALDSLPEHELAYLYYLAYSGADALQHVDRKGLLLPSDEGNWKASQSQCRNMAETLRRKRYLVLEDGYYVSDSATLTVDWEDRVDVIIHMYENHEKWVPAIRHASVRSMEAIILCYATEYIVVKRAGMLDSLVPLALAGQKTDLPSGLADAVFKVMDMAESSTLPGLLPDWVMAVIVKRELDKVDSERDCNALCRAHKCLMSIPDPGRRLVDCYCVCRMYWYYFTGELMPEIPGGGSHEDTLFLNGAIKLFQSDVDGAIADFVSAINLQKTYGADVKGLPFEPINTFLYICARGIRQNVDDIAALKLLYETPSRRSNGFGTWHELLAGAILGHSMRKSRYITPSWKYVGNWEKILNRLALVYAFGTDEVSVCAEDCVGGCALIDNEMCAQAEMLLHVSKEWHYEPILPRIKRKEQWESRLSELINMVAPYSGGNANGERLIYCATPLSPYVEIRQQSKLKSGGYSKGRVLSEAKYRRGDCQLDSLDTKIRNEWMAGHSIGMPPLSFVIPFCVGTDKLFAVARRGRDFSPVQVSEEKPYLSTIRKEGRIHFTSNVGLDVLKRAGDGGNIICNWSENSSSVSFFTLDSKMARILATLLELKSVPAEAEPMLESLFAPLQGRLEVQSDVKGGVQLERKEGSAVLCARLTRESDYYLVNFLARPLDDGTVYSKPGTGNEVVLDSNANGRYEVVRDLKKEKRALRKAMEILDCHKCEDCIVLPATLLHVLENPSSFKDVFYLEWPEGQEIRLKAPSASDFNITANGKGGWFELEGDLKVSEDMVLSVAQLLEMTRAGQRFVKLGENDYLRLSDQLRAQLVRLSSVAQNSHGKLVVPELAMSVIADGVDDIVEVADEQMLLERRKLIKEASELEFPIPEGLNAVLRPYQEDGFRWMMRLSHWHAGACLADDMGLGKTVQTIAFMLAHASEGPQLVVAPASVVGNWENEIRCFAPGLRVVVVNSFGASERKKVVGDAGAGVIFISTYGVLASAIKSVAGVEWTSAILDEAHTIKNKDTKMSAAVMSLKARNKVILTGTPIQNHLGELWNLFRFINPGLLGSFEHFQETYVSGDGSGSRDTLKRLVSPFMLRRTKAEVVKELPDKTEIIVPVDLSESEMAVYEVLRREARNTLEQTDCQDISTSKRSGSLNINALAMMTKLRMASCSSSLVESAWTGENSKLEVFEQKLRDIVDGGNNVLVFSQFTSFLELARQRAHAMGIKDYLYLDGSTPVAKRRKMVDEFQQGKAKVFFISLKAGGLGLNLTGANYVIHLDPWWNPAIEQQATDRAYRIGQKQNVTVYHLISTGTIEEKILRLHSTKQQLADAILSGSSTSHKMTAEQILELIG